MSNPKVCVIMPVYNGAKTIELALKSLLAQTYTNWVCIIVNDGSIDGTRVILDSLKDQRFKVIHLDKNVGRGAARQVCLENVEGKYLAYLDSDDFYHHDKLRLQVDILENDSRIGLVSGGVLIYNNDHIPQNVRVRKIETTMFKDGDPMPIVMPTAMIRMDGAVKTMYNTRLNAGEDIDYFSRYLNYGYYMALDNILMYYCVGTTTYKKVLEYAFNEVLRGWILANRVPLKGVKLFLLSCLKLVFYFILIPFIGVKNVINKRGKAPSPQQLKEFYQEINTLKSISNEKISE